MDRSFYALCHVVRSQTVLVNSPREEEKSRLQKLLKEIRDLEDEILG